MAWPSEGGPSRAHIFSSFCYLGKKRNYRPWRPLTVREPPPRGPEGGQTNHRSSKISRAASSPSSPRGPRRAHEIFPGDGASGGRYLVNIEASNVFLLPPWERVDRSSSCRPGAVIGLRTLTLSRARNRMPLGSSLQENVIISGLRREAGDEEAKMPEISV